jgi:hypothetical protein
VSDDLIVRVRDCAAVQRTVERRDILLKAAARIAELEAELRVIADEVAVTGGEFWLDTDIADRLPVFCAMVDAIYYPDNNSKESS